MYTCPMHPEVVSDKPGNCPKCGMSLVPLTTKPQITKHNGYKGLGVLTWKSYIPLGVIFLMIVAVSVITSWSGEFSWTKLILNFMTGFFLVFAGFKLLDLKGFAEGYSSYDLLASRIKAYGYVYPFIELAFGLIMLSGFHPTWLLWTEVVVMVFSGIGVSIKLAQHEEIQCACLGTFLKLPLTKITIVEDFGMAVLALIVLFI